MTIHFVNTYACTHIYSSLMIIPNIVFFLLTLPFPFLSFPYTLVNLLRYSKQNPSFISVLPLPHSPRFISYYFDCFFFSFAFESPSCLSNSLPFLTILFPSSFCSFSVLIWHLFQMIGLKHIMDRIFGVTMDALEDVLLGTVLFPSVCFLFCFSLPLICFLTETRATRWRRRLMESLQNDWTSSLLAIGVEKENIINLKSLFRCSFSILFLLSFFKSII